VVRASLLHDDSSPASVRGAALSSLTQFLSFGGAVRLTNSARETGLKPAPQLRGAAARRFPGDRHSF
jgi:hypothetical protein